MPFRAVCFMTRSINSKCTNEGMTQMSWLMILFIGLASSIDNFAVGLTYAIKGKKITWTANMLIAGIALVISYAALLIGQWLGLTLSPSLTDIFGGLIILLIGVWSLIDALRHRSSAPIPEADTVDKDKNNIIVFNEVFILGIALSINALGTSFGAGMSHLQPIGVALFVSIFSFVSVAGGQWLGFSGLQSNLGKVSEFIASFLLIAIGLYSILATSI
ncbi:MAG: manganese efflux pump [Sporolactobacillus sp.]